MLQLHPSTPAGWLVVAVPEAVLMLEFAAVTDTTPALLINALRTGVPEVLEILTAGGLSRTPAFALVTRNPRASVRALARGSARVSVELVDGRREVSGDGVETWLEQSFDSVASFRIDTGAGPVRGEQLLPLETGAMWADSVEFESDTVIPATASAPVSPAQQAPANKSAPPPEPEPLALDDATVAAPLDPDDEQPGQNEPAHDEPAPAPKLSGYDHLFGETVARAVEDAAVRPQESDGDHDGLTVMSGDLHALRGHTSKPVDVPPPPPAALFCLELSDGTIEPLDRTVLAGRAPSVTKLSGDEVPRLLTLSTPDGDISRNHVRVAVEGGTVVVTDLHSRNGTMIVLPGKSPEKLRQGVPTSVVVDTVIDLGGGVDLTVRRVGSVAGN